MRCDELVKGSSARGEKRQPAGEPVAVGSWALSEDYPFYPVGSKPKRMLICPEHVPEDFLIPGHSYLFKQALGWQQYQVWSEVIAYRLGALLGLDVPPCFIAVDEKSGEIGALVEFFYGYPWERPHYRFVHAADLLSLKDRKRGRPHYVTRNMRLSRVHRVGCPEIWWARTLLFDALIRNTDRHPENWGFMVRRILSPEESEHSEQSAMVQTDTKLAPIFDNATSLGYEIRNSKIPDMLESGALTRYIARGKHHAGWGPGHEATRGHVELCRRFLELFPDMVREMIDMLDFEQSQIDAIVEECSEFRTPLRVSRERGELISRLVDLRRNALSVAIGEI